MPQPRAARSATEPRQASATARGAPSAASVAPTIQAATQPDRARPEPADRSISPETITMAMPQAMIPYLAARPDREANGP